SNGALKNFYGCHSELARNLKVLRAEGSRDSSQARNDNDLGDWALGNIGSHVGSGSTRAGGGRGLAEFPGAGRSLLRLGAGEGAHLAEFLVEGFEQVGHFHLGEFVEM